MAINATLSDPTLNSFATDDLVVNIISGSLFYRSNTKLYRLTGDDISTATNEQGGGGAGTITQVTAGTGLSGGGTSGNVTLNWTQTASLAGIYWPPAQSGAIGASGNNPASPGEDGLLIGMYDSGTSDNALMIRTDGGYTIIGPRNNSFSHFYTDRSRYYFNKRIVVDEGIVTSYNEDLTLRRQYNNTNYDQITIGTGSLEAKLNNTTVFYVTSSISGGNAVAQQFMMGLGTSTPTGKLHIYEASGSQETKDTATILLEHGDYPGKSSIVFKSAAPGDGGDRGFIQFVDDDGTFGSTTENGLMIIGVKNDSSTENADRLKIEINTIDAMMFDEDGQVGINDVTPGYRLDVNGTCRVYGFTNSSDGRFKENINSIINPLKTIKKLNGVTYEWKDQKIKKDDDLKGIKYGFIGQEVEKIIPSIVSSKENKRLNTDNFKSVNYVEIIPILVEAIKEQQVQINELKNKIGE